MTIIYFIQIASCILAIASVASLLLVSLTTLGTDEDDISFLQERKQMMTWLLVSLFVFGSIYIFTLA